MGKRAVSRRDFLRIGGGAGVGLFFIGQIGGQLFGCRWRRQRSRAARSIRCRVPKYRDADADPAGDAAGGHDHHAGRQAGRLLRDLDEAVRPADPAGGAPGHDGVGLRRGRRAEQRGACWSHNAPSLTIEAQYNRPVRVKWINDLVDANGNFLPHLLPVDPTLHWANPPGGIAGRDTRPTFTSTPGPYTGPVPIVTHAHGAVGVGDESDGYAEAWYLPAADNIPAGYATEGTWYDFFAGKAAAQLRRDLGAGVRHLPVPEPRPGGDHLVPRPHPGHDPAQRLRRTGRLLHHPRRPRRRRRRARQPHRSHGVAARAGAPRGRHVPAQQALPGDPHRHPGPLVQRRRVALLPRHPGLLRRVSPARTSPTPTSRRSGTRSSSAT